MPNSKSTSSENSSAQRPGTETAWLGHPPQPRQDQLPYPYRCDQANLIPSVLTARQISHVYASEADLLNMALFGITAGEWRAANPDLKGNIRDYATIEQLVCLSNMESLNAVFIEEGKSQSERLKKLNQIAISQLQILLADHDVKALEEGS